LVKNLLRVIPLGGLGEIGKNMMALEMGHDIVVIDAGVLFPKEEMLGVDLVIPDISYLIENRSKVRAILITHGHEDHIGALPYILRELNVPVYAPKLAYALIQARLSEHRQLKDTKLHPIEPGQKIKLGTFQAEFFRVCHSIPDAMGIALRTPLGLIIHTGDFKIDHTPVDGRKTDLAKLAQYANEGVLLLCSDSTYADVPGYTPSEQLLGDTLEQIIANAPGRVMVATFASLISRIQQVLNAAHKHGRRVAVFGRSMVNNVRLTIKMGYLDAPDGVITSAREMRQIPNDKIVIVITGSQGETTSALVRISNKLHKDIEIIPEDTVVVSAAPIPGNETAVSRTIDNLFRQGAQVLYHRISLVHVHGHASQEELKTMINLVRPQYFVPVHGEYRMLIAHAEIAQNLGIPSENVFILEDGDVLELSRQSGKIVERVPAGHIYVDGLNMLGTQNTVLGDRKILSRDGVVTVVLSIDRSTGNLSRPPEIVSRGIVDITQEKDLIKRAAHTVYESLDHSSTHTDIQSEVKSILGDFLYKETKQRPMILPIIIEV
jgi:ribonuclease J